MLVAMVIAMFMVSLFVKFKLREVLGNDTYWLFDAQLISQLSASKLF